MNFDLKRSTIKDQGLTVTDRYAQREIIATIRDIFFIWSNRSDELSNGRAIAIQGLNWFGGQK